MNGTLKVLNPLCGSLTQRISSPWLALSESTECLAPISSKKVLSCAQISELVISMRKQDSSSQNRGSSWNFLSFVSGSRLLPQTKEIIDLMSSRRLLWHLPCCQKPAPISLRDSAFLPAPRSQTHVAWQCPQSLWMLIFFQGFSWQLVKCPRDCPRSGSSLVDGGRSSWIWGM